MRNRAGFEAVPALLLVACLAGVSPGARADTFAGASYDAASDSLVVTLLYRGTDARHLFTLQWGRCADLGDGTKQIAAEVLDSQWDDPAKHDYRKTVRFDLAGLHCRPAEVTLRTAPGFHLTLFVPRPAPRGARRGSLIPFRSAPAAGPR